MLRAGATAAPSWKLCHEPATQPWKTPSVAFHCTWPAVVHEVDVEVVVLKPPADPAGPVGPAGPIGPAGPHRPHPPSGPPPPGTPRLSCPPPRTPPPTPPTP